MNTYSRPPWSQKLFIPALPARLRASSRLDREDRQPDRHRETPACPALQTLGSGTGQPRVATGHMRSSIYPTRLLSISDPDWLKTFSR